MYMFTFIDTYNMYRWHGSKYVSIVTIGYYVHDMPLAGCASVVVCGYVNFAKLWKSLCLHSCPINITTFAFL